MRIALLLIVVLFSSGCASILNPRYQKIPFNVEENDVVYIDNIIAIPQEGKYLFKRDLKAKQVTIKTKGAHDRNLVLLQYKKSPLNILSFVPFGILLFPMYMDALPKAFNYHKEIVVPAKINTISEKDGIMKNLNFNRVVADLNKDDASLAYYVTYKDYLNNKVKSIYYNDDNEYVKLENSVYAEALNQVLIEKGYVDTVNSFLHKNYVSNLFINAAVKKSDLIVANLTEYTQGLIYARLVMKWELLDYYKNVIYTIDIESTSGEYVVIEYDRLRDFAEKSLKDAMEISLLMFMNTDSVNWHLTKKSLSENDDNFEEIVLKPSSVFASNIDECTRSMVAIKSKDRLGSGFFITNDGYIITNYHIVSDTNNLKVFTSDGNEFSATILRENRLFDLALLKIEGGDFLPLKLDTLDKLMVGTDVYVLGAQTEEDLSIAISEGIISGVRKLQKGSKLIQTDASVNYGNSGGAIILKSGDVIGIVNSKITGYSIEGVAFGIPVNEISDKLKIIFK